MIFLADKYTIHPMNFALTYGQAWFKVGDLIDILTGSTIVGPYCAWPKTDPSYFVINANVDPIDMEVRTFIDRKTIFKQNEGKVKFYQKLNRKKW